MTDITFDWSQKATRTSVVEALVERILRALASVRANSGTTHSRLLAPFVSLKDRDPISGTHDFGFSKRSDGGLEMLRDRLTELGGPGWALQDVVSQLERRDQLCRDWESHRYVGHTAGRWRGDVRKACVGPTDAARAAEDVVKTWRDSCTFPIEPIGQLVGNRWFLFAEDFLRLPGTRSIDAARQLIASGRYGTPLKIAGRSCVELEDVLRA